MKRYLVALLISLPAISYAEDVGLAMRLGDLAGSESICGYQIDQAKLEALIKKKVKADDMDFASTMATSAAVIVDDYDAMATSVKTAHCVQMRRLAEALDLTP